MAKRTKRKAKTGEGDREVIRCDRLRLVPNRAKAADLETLQRFWRDVAAELAADQWRRFQDGCGFDPMADVATDQRKTSAFMRSWLLGAIAHRHGLEAEPQEAAEVSADGAPRRKPRKPPPEMMPGLVDPFAEAKSRIGAAQFQMVRKQVVGMLRSFVSNRQNDFVDAVSGSSLWPKPKPGETTTGLDPKLEKHLDKQRHMLFAVNKAQAWFDFGRAIRVTDKDGTYVEELVPIETRRLARWIMRGVLRRHNKPSMRGIGMVVDRRIATLGVPESAKGFSLWLTLTVARGRRIDVPVVVHDRFLERKGKRSAVLQVNRDDETGEWSVGVPTDQSEVAAASTEAYLSNVLVERLTLDFGLATMFATDQGDLVGRDFLDKLRRLDATIQGIARHVQRSGGKPRDSVRYRKHVARLRGFVTTELNRVINRLVEKHRPGMLVLERLRFTNPLLSRRLNRIISNCGRSVLRNKLKALEEEKGVTSLLVPCAYSSQTCSSCGYVDPRNRRSRSRFECRFCGLKIHADVNAARVLAKRRSPATKDTDHRDGRAGTLAGLVQGHGERWPDERRKPLHGRTRGGGAPPDPRRTNPYFKGWSWCVEARSPDVGNGGREVAGNAGARKASATSYAT